MLGGNPEALFRIRRVVERSFSVASPWRIRDVNRMAVYPITAARRPRRNRIRRAVESPAGDGGALALAFGIGETIPTPGAVQTATVSRPICLKPRPAVRDL